MVWEKCFARVRFCAQGGRYEKLITLCGQQGVPLEHVRPVPGGFTAALPARYYRHTARLARRCRTRLRVQKKQGLYFRCKRYRGRWGLAVGPLLFLAAIALFGKTVWAIRWEGLSTVQQRQVEAALYHMDIYEGAFLTQEKIRLSEKQLLSQSQELGWISLNFGKGRLVVEAAPAREKPVIEPNDAVDLVAAADGIVLETNVQEGFLQKKVGQTVAQGDVLISAVLPDHNLIPIESHAKGSVIAAVKKTYQCTQPLVYAANALTGEVQSEKALRLGPWRLALGRQSLAQQEDVKIRHEHLGVLGFALPVTLEERLNAPSEQQEFHLDQQAAREYAHYACMQQLYAEFPGAELVTESAQEDWQDGALVYTLTVDLKADITRPQAG